MRRIYADYFEKVFQFAEYGDYENFFIQLGYAVRESDFISRVGAPLRNITACNGEPIFKSDNLDFSKYKLLFENVEKSSGGWLMVKELYGYAPQTVYNTYSAEPVQIPGITDPSGYLKEAIPGRNLPNSSYDEQTDRYTIAVGESTASSLAVGDLVTFSRDLYSVGSSWIAGVETPTVPILQKDSTTITTEAFQAVYNYPGGGASSPSKKDFVRDLNLSNANAYYAVYVIRQAATREPSMRIVSIKSNISFSEAFPALDSRLVISAGQSETDTITDTTTPSVSEWRQWIAAGQYYNVQDAQVEIVFPKTFFKKIVKTTLPR